jgi:hypothetical protein
MFFSGWVKSQQQEEGGLTIFLKLIGSLFITLTMITLTMITLSKNSFNNKKFEHK